MEGTVEKRKKISLSRQEADILAWLLIKTLVPVLVIVLISSAILFFGLQFLMKTTSFGNYGLTPGHSLQSVSQFITAYVFIALSNVVLMLLLSATVIYIVIRDMVLPILRVTREMQQGIESGEKKPIIVRKSDKLLIPLIEMINKMS